MSLFPEYLTAKGRINGLVLSRLGVSEFARRIFESADRASKVEEFNRFADAQLVSWSSMRCNRARSVVLDAKSVEEVELSLLQMIKSEDDARQFWIDNALRPWCDRHGLTLRQGLSVLMDDGAFNLADPDRALPTKEDVFWPSGHHLDFAARLGIELAASPTPIEKLVKVQLRRWDVEDGSTAPLPTEPTYEATARVSPGSIHIDVEPRVGDALSQDSAAQEFETPLDRLPGLSIGIEIIDGCPVVHVHNRGEDELKQSIFALPGNGSSRLVARPGDAPLPVPVPAGFSPDLQDVVEAFKRAHAFMDAWRSQQELLALEVPGDAP